MTVHAEDRPAAHWWAETIKESLGVWRVLKNPCFGVLPVRNRLRRIMYGLNVHVGLCAFLGPYVLDRHSEELRLFRPTSRPHNTRRSLLLLQRKITHSLL